MGPSRVGGRATIVCDGCGAELEHILAERCDICGGTFCPDCIDTHTCTGTREEEV